MNYIAPVLINKLKKTTMKNTKHYQPTKKEIEASLNFSSALYLYDILRIQHDNEENETELSEKEIKAQRKAVEDIYKGALLIQNALKNLQFA